MEIREIWCCGCNVKVQARLTDGAEIYSHRPDLGTLPFWKCDTCKNYVGCHWKTAERTQPLGNIPTMELRIMRCRIHKVLDPLWRKGIYKRRTLYKMVGEAMQRNNYHTAQIRTFEEAKKVFDFVTQLKLKAESGAINE